MNDQVLAKLCVFFGQGGSNLSLLWGAREEKSNKLSVCRKSVCIIFFLPYQYVCVSVSISLCLCNYPSVLMCLCYCPWVCLCVPPFLGSNPDRGQSPVEWGEIPSVRLSIFPTICYLVGIPALYLRGLRACWKGHRAYHRGLRACQRGLHDQQRGPRAC